MPASKPIHEGSGAEVDGLGEEELGELLLERLRARGFPVDG